LPAGVADIGVDDAGVGVVAVQRLLTTGTAAVSERASRVGGSLAREGFGEGLFGQDVAELEEELLDVGEFGAPGRPLGTVELLDEVFGDALDVGTHFFHQRTPLLGRRHVPFLSALAPSRATCFSRSV
jgi:hypothetical protein